MKKNKRQLGKESLIFSNHKIAIRYFPIPKKQTANFTPIEAITFDFLAH